MSDVILRVDADTREAEAKIGKLGNKSINLNTKNFNQPLGKITGQLGEFEKSLEASNARVIAFGASAGAIFAVQRALSETIKSAIDVEKSLTDINVILNLSSESLSKFGGSLFDIAKNTGNTFKSVAEAATELSRQGLGVEETLKRTQNALILTRLSGLGAADAVEALTATINGFSKEALNSSEIVNKFAAVDAAFAVSSADLAEAVKRVGSSASEAGVSLDQLIGIVTAAQQITARGGAVIGNSFKTIFTRLQRPKVLDDLEALGVATRDAQGNFLPLIGILQGLARSYDGLNSVQKASIAETVGGVFQINVLKAALSDLGKEYSVYGRALQISNSATDEATSRNEQLNKTLSSLLNRTVANLTQAGAKIGGEAFQPGIEKILNSLNSFLEDFSSKDTESVGAKIAQGIVTGLGSFLSGPGILLAGKALFVIFERLATFSADALKTILGLNSRAAEQAQIQKQIFDLLSKNPQIIQQINQGTISVEQTQSLILKTIQEQTVAMQQQIGLAKTLASSLSQVGVSIATTGIGKGRIQAKYAGYIPNFANQDQLIENTGAAQHGYKAGRAYRKTLYDGSGGSFPAVVNSAETVKTFKNSIGKKATIVEPPNGFAGGFIPNFAKIIEGNYPEKTTASKKLGLIYAQKAPLNSDTSGAATFGGYDIPIKFESSGFSGKRIKKPQDADLEKQLGDYIVKFTNNFANKIFEPNGQLQKSAKITSADELSNIGSFKSITGTVFETAVDLAAGKINEGRGQNAGVDFASPNPFIRNLFNNIQASQLEAKVNANKNQLDSVAQKAIQNGLISPQLKKIIDELGGKYETQKKKAGQKKASIKLTGGKSKGFIPNFAALEEAVKREENAGINSSLIRVDSASELVSNSNPLGLGVYNTKDEPAGLKQGINRNKFSGYVPNFAKVDQGLSDEQKIKMRVQRNTPAASMTSPKLELKLAENAVKTTSSFNQLNKGLQEAGKSAADFGKKITTETAGMQEFRGRLAFAGIAASQIAGQLQTFGKDNGLAEFTANIAEGAATFSTVAAIIPGHIGLAAGAILGLGQAVNSIVKDFENSELKEVIKKSEMAAESLGQLSESGQRYVSSFENLSDAYSSGNPKLIQKAQESFAQSLNDLPEEFRKQFSSAKNLAEAQDLYAQALSKQSKSGGGEKVAGSLAQSMMASQQSIYRQGFDFLFRNSNQRRGEDIGVFTGDQAAGKGVQLANKFGAQTVQGLNTKFIEDLGKNLVDTNLKGKDFIKMLEQYGLTTEQVTVFSKLNNDVAHDGAANFEILRNAIIQAGKSSIETAKKAKESFSEIQNSASSMKDIINEALAFTSQQNLKELAIGQKRGFAETYKPFMSDASNAQIESSAKVDEINATREQELYKLRMDHLAEFEQAERDGLGLKKELLIEQAKINQAAEQSINLEKQRLSFVLQQVQNQKMLNLGGGTEGLFSGEGLVKMAGDFTRLNEQIAGTSSPIAKAFLEGKKLQTLKGMGADLSSPAFAPILKQISAGVSEYRKNIFGSLNPSNTGESQGFQKLKNDSDVATKLQLAEYTQNFDLVKDSINRLGQAATDAGNAVNNFGQGLGQNGANTVQNVNQRSTSGGAQEINGKIEVVLSPLVITLNGKVDAELDPVNQKIIQAMKDTIMQLEGKVNSLGLLQSKLGPTSK
jgi:TP901 family phage tail tape measure protein